MTNSSNSPPLFIPRSTRTANPPSVVCSPKTWAWRSQNQYEFFIQRMHGPSLYSDRKGHPALRDRHAHFHIEKQHADKWLKYMREAMEEVEIPEDLRVIMDEYFTDVAYFLQNVDKDGKRIYG
jgi:truncated hemoglobin YjbI